MHICLHSTADGTLDLGASVKNFSLCHATTDICLHSEWTERLSALRVDSTFGLWVPIWHSLQQAGGGEGEHK